MLASLVIDRGADIWAADNWARPPLHLASSGGHQALVRVLRDHGATWFPPSFRLNVPK
ncbi:hypothetical protein BZA05DRAFT_387793 [Tricharina praecox]|uniref:uncharacterized protein n=1 Tax=Tricharina praecox TaxID=43433 RepID=UPI00221E6F24|nr:uncharacterized protein BZA05DRAFT_387793 [Tricharina praecox]KAI5856228.1 hypothetical protein BZA05DRAFT_387793 [Tricharina praecox]